MLVTFKTEKHFPDGSTEIVLKRGYLQSLKSRRKAQITKLSQKMERQSRDERLVKEINECSFFEMRKRKLLENELNEVNLLNWKRAARRARQVLYDICKCNDFLYFVTLTFSPDEVARLDDKLVKRKFSQWANYIRKKFPTMYYVAVPEYHKKGGLHFHLLVGGVTMEELQAVPALTKKGRLKYKHGKQIFNITAWRLGFSTLSCLENVEAAKHYVCKYITKQHYDGRFFRKRRYYCSANVARPEICKAHCEDSIWALDLDLWEVKHLNPEKQYGIFRLNADGVVDREYNSAEVRQHVADICGGAHSARARAPRVPYSTIGTLERNVPLETVQSWFRELDERIKRGYTENSLLQTTYADIQYLDSIGLLA